LDLSVVIPAKNEQDNIAPLVSEIELALSTLPLKYEIIYVDDGSTDATAQVIQELAAIKKMPLKLVRHKSSCGQSTAIYTGVNKAQGKLIVTLDADGQNNPADIPAMLNAASLLPATSDFCIAGYRKQRKDTTWKRFQSRIANRVRSAILHDNTPDTGCGLKVFPRATFLKLPYFDHMHRFLPALVRRAGGKVVITEVSHRDRQFGTSKYTMLGRVGVGIVDMAGVLWLQRRSKSVEILN